VNAQPDFGKENPPEDWGHYWGEEDGIYVEFELKPLRAQDDVDQKELAESLNGGALEDKTFQHRLYISSYTEPAHLLTRFLLDDLGIEGTNLRQMIPEAMGKKILVKIGHDPRGSTIPYQKVLGTSKVKAV
jgi:hypothetical protein